MIMRRHKDTRMDNPTFRQRCRNEWQRLNPTYGNAEDGFSRAFFAAFRETVPGYFAPLRFLWWLVVNSWRQP